MSVNPADILAKLLASTYFLFLKTQNYHWNVTGTDFVQLHALFETQYNEMFKAIDLIAEQIRMYGDRAPGSFAEFSGLSVIEGCSDKVSSVDMVRYLGDDHRVIVTYIKNALKDLHDSDNETCKALLTERLCAHEKMCWMLESSMM